MADVRILVGLRAGDLLDWFVVSRDAEAFAALVRQLRSGVLAVCRRVCPDTAECPESEVHSQTLFSHDPLAGVKCVWYSG